MMINIERAKRTPSVHFASPREVENHEYLTKEEKIEILLRWRYDAVQLETAQGENMQSEEDSQLRAVLKALHRLREGD